jgi:hypothetical protein
MVTTSVSVFGRFIHFIPGRRKRKTGLFETRCFVFGAAGGILLISPFLKEFLDNLPFGVYGIYMISVEDTMYICLTIQIGLHKMEDISRQQNCLLFYFPLQAASFLQYP